MCLSRRMDPLDIRDYKPVKGQEYYEGWKTFYGDGDGKLSTILCGNNKSIGRGRWLKEEEYRGISAHGNLQYCDYDYWDIVYPTGFHVCLTEEGARKWRGVTLKIRFRNPVAWGYQDGDPVAVAKEIFIPKDTTNAPLS